MHVDDRLEGGTAYKLEWEQLPPSVGNHDM